jgi:hypothetical protein
MVDGGWWMLDWMAEATGKVKKLKAEREMMRYLCFFLKKKHGGEHVNGQVMF